MKKITNFFIGVVEKFMPDPFIYAVCLSIIVFLMGIFINHDTPMQMVIHWGNGFWSFLAFGMQMALVVVFGQALATAPPIAKLIKSIAAKAKTPKQAIVYATVVGSIAMYINWGVGLIVGAIFSKEVAKRVKGVDYRLLLAASYSTMIMEMPSCTILLKAASNVEELTKVTNGVVTKAIPTSQTIWSPMMNLIMIILLVTMPILFAKMMPDPDKTVTIDPKLLVDEENEKIIAKTPAEKMENFAGFNIIVFICAAIIIYRHFILKGQGLTIDMMNFCLMTLCMILHGKPINYINACQEATSGAGGIILQFPFYAGIMGMMTGNNAAGINLAKVIAGGMVNVATHNTLPLFCFTTAAILNFFVPSSGGLWAIQAPFMFPAAQTLGVNYSIIVMAMALGETWTNIIQPFWALPMLGIAGLKVRDIMGFCTLACIWQGIVLVPIIAIFARIM
jgi:short-chain fatty acids transporter